MTPEKLAELEALEAAATPGPWEEEEFYIFGDYINGYEVCGPTVDNVNYAIANKALLPALRNNASALFAALREAWRERNDIREFVDDLIGSKCKSFPAGGCPSWVEFPCLPCQARLLSKQGQADE